MDEMEFTEAESNVLDLVHEYIQAEENWEESTPLYVKPEWIFSRK